MSLNRFCENSKNLMLTLFESFFLNLQHHRVKSLFCKNSIAFFENWTFLKMSKKKNRPYFIFAFSNFRRVKLCNYSIILQNIPTIGSQNTLFYSFIDLLLRTIKKCSLKTLLLYIFENI